MQVPSRTVASEPICSARTAVISSPILAVFAVIAAGSGPRRGHVICSDVFAVAAVTAAGVMFWSTPARWTRTARAPRPRWPAPVGAWCCRAGDGSSWAGRAFRVTVVAPIVRTRYEQGSAARREAPWRRPPAPRRHRSARPRLGTAPHRDHLPAAGIAPRSARPRARPPAAHHAQARPPGLDDIDDDLSRSCGGDMSTPQKCPPTRHYLQTTSDNRRSVRAGWRVGTACHRCGCG